MRFRETFGLLGEAGCHVISSTNWIVVSVSQHPRLRFRSVLQVWNPQIYESVAL